MNEGKCQYKPTERTGLYIMVIIILLWGPCSNRDIGDKQLQIIDRLDRIEKIIKTEKKNGHPFGTVNNGDRYE